MIRYEWFHSAHPPIQPRAKVVAPSAALFRSKRGHLVATRPFAPSDSRRLIELLAGLSAQSLFLRYCMPMPRIAPEMLAREDARLGRPAPQQFTIIALADVEGLEQVIGVAELVRDASSPTVAEMALVVADAFQGEGVGSALCAYLMAAARRQGLAVLRATALAENTAVRRMVARSGVPYTTETRQGMTTLQLDLRNVGQLGGIALA